MDAVNTVLLIEVNQVHVCNVTVARWVTRVTAVSMFNQKSCKSFLFIKGILKNLYIIFYLR